MTVPERLERFLDENQILCVATAASGQSYSAPVFYAYLRETVGLAFLSDLDSRHGRDALANPQASGAIASSGKSIGDIRGVQILGRIVCLGATDGLVGAAAETYSRFLDRIPEARGQSSCLWEFACDWMKFTDNSREFGFKEIWSRP